MRGGVTASSRRRRPPTRPVRERLDLRPRVGPPSATRSSTVRGRPRGFPIGASIVSAAASFVAPDPRRPRRPRERVPVLRVSARPASGNASSRWVSAVASRGASSEASRSAEDAEPESPVALAPAGVDPAPPPRPRPRPPRLRRRLAGAAVAVPSSVAVVLPDLSSPSAPDFDRAGASVAALFAAVADAEPDALALGLAAVELGDGDRLAPDVSPFGRRSEDFCWAAGSVSAAEAALVDVDAPPPAPRPPRPPRPRPPRLRRLLVAPVPGPPGPGVPAPEAGSAPEPDPGSDPAPASGGWAVVRVTAASVVTGDSWFIRYSLRSTRGSSANANARSDDGRSPDGRSRCGAGSASLGARGLRRCTLGRARHRAPVTSFSGARVPPRGSPAVPGPGGGGSRASSTSGSRWGAACRAALGEQICEPA